MPRVLESLYVDLMIDHKLSLFSYYTLMLGLTSVLLYDGIYSPEQVTICYSSRHTQFQIESIRSICILSSYQQYSEKVASTLLWH